jgi:hypothetical protein
MNIEKLSLEQLRRERRRWYKVACRQADYGNWKPTNRLREIELEIEWRREGAGDAQEN